MKPRTVRNLLNDFMPKASPRPLDGQLARVYTRAMRISLNWVLPRPRIVWLFALAMAVGCAASGGGSGSGGASVAGQGAVGGTAGTGGVGGSGAMDSGGPDATSNDAASMPIDSAVMIDSATTDATTSDAMSVDASDAMTTSSDASSDAGNAVTDAGSDAFVINMDAALADAGLTVDANYADTSPDSRAGYCMGQGPPVSVNDSRDGITYDACTGAIAGRVFTNSVCACDDVSMVGFLTTRSFHSGQGQTSTNAIAQGAPVGVNDLYSATGYTDVGGTMVIAGSGNTVLYQYMKIGGDLKMNGELGVQQGFGAAGLVTVLRDAWFKQDVYLSLLGFLPTGIMEIGRELHQPSGEQMFALTTVNGALYSGTTPHNQPFTVPAPCACADSEILDIAAIVDRGRVVNDNADIGLSPDVFNLNFGIGLDLTLPCGRFYVNQIGSLGTVTLHIPGRTALFVGGDVGDLGIFDVDLGPQGELDIFIKGNLVSIGATSFGDRNRPSATRVYVSGSGDVAIVGLGEFVGNVYAPRARIFSLGYAQVFGSLFGRRVDMGAGLDVFYDRDILDVGADCPPPEPEPMDAGTPMPDSGGPIVDAGGPVVDAGGPPPPVCTQCSNSCANRQACVNNMCVGCTNDSQCCAPLVCYPSSGRCGPLLE